MEPASAAQVFWIPPIWTPEWGFHWDQLFNYFLGIFLFGGQAKAFVDVFFDFLKALVNKIHFTMTLPVFGKIYIDFSKYTWDDEFFDYVKDKVKMKIAAKESDAKNIKLKYKPLVEDPSLTPEERDALMLKYHEELKVLTTKTVEEIKTFHPEIWTSALSRFKDEGLATIFLENNVKAGVVANKNGSATIVSMTDTVKNLSTTSTEGAHDA